MPSAESARIKAPRGIESGEGYPPPQWGKGLGRVVKIFEDTFIPCNRMYERDGQTDRNRMTARPRLHSIARQKS